MKKNPLLLLIVGLALLAVGGFIWSGSGPAKADSATMAQCQDRMQDQGADMMAKCQEKAFATAMTATDADEAARAISSANNSEVGGNMLGMFLIGIGIVMAAGGGYLMWQQSANKTR
ncbi:hypothetical protein ACSBM8_00365 [Sphingomonas sp. ASY06-1R]|uniref:hypothetical protein n=1 Tax=Sphingomonas sp. ASY06-1R TaxID=3445771 RepID=UPI003FA2D424